MAFKLSLTCKICLLLFPCADQHHIYGGHSSCHPRPHTPFQSQSVPQEILALFLVVFRRSSQRRLTRWVGLQFIPQISGQVGWTPMPQTKILQGCQQFKKIRSLSFTLPQLEQFCLKIHYSKNDIHCTRFIEILLRLSGRSLQEGGGEEEEVEGERGSPKKKTFHPTTQGSSKFSLLKHIFLKLNY